MAAGYLALTGAGETVKGPLDSGRTGDKCPPPRQAGPANERKDAGSCGQAVDKASALAAEFSFDAAETALSASGCPAAEIRKHRETLKMFRRLAGSQPADHGKGYRFTAAAGLWKTEKGGFSAAYGGDEGFECRDGEGSPSRGRGCLPPASALLSCIEEHRFDGREETEPGTPDLTDALRKAGYIQ